MDKRTAKMDRERERAAATQSGGRQRTMWKMRGLPAAPARQNGRRRPKIGPGSSFLLICCAMLLIGCGTSRQPDAGPATPASAATPATSQGSSERVDPPANAAVNPPDAQPVAPVPEAATSAPTATPTAIPTAIAIPTATPTTMPDEQLDRARRLLRFGEHSAARTELTSLATAELSDPWIKLQARYTLALAYLADNLYAEALTTLATLDPQEQMGTDAAQQVTDLLARAVYLRAEAYLATNQPGPAVAAYWQFLETYPWMAEAVQPRIAAAYLAMGDVESAALAYSRADEAIAQHPEDRAGRVRNLEQKAQSLSDYGRFAEAAATYAEILNIAQNSGYRADILYRAGQALAAAGNPAAAIESWRAASTEAPDSSKAYLSLIELVNRQVDFDLYQRGYIDLMAGAWTPAVNAYQAYLDIADVSDARAPLAMLGLGQAYLGAENYSASIEALDNVLTTYPDCSCLGEAWLAKARAQAGLGDSTGAHRTYRTFAREYAGDPLAPEALWRSGWLALNSGKQLEAAIDFVNLADAFPASERAPSALHLVGLGAFQQGLYGQAAGMFERLQSSYPDFRWPEVAYWLGRSRQATGETEEASRQWQGLSERAPDIYYGLMAGLSLQNVELTQGRMLSEVSRVIGPRSTIAADNGEQAVAEKWLRTWIESADSQALHELPPAVAQDSDLKAGRILLELGQRSQALSFLERLYRRHKSDPRVLYALSLELERLGAYRLSLIAMARLLHLSPAELVEDAPIFVQERVYPRRFAELVDREALAHNLDPFLYYSLIRQESLFEEGARSVAAAQGLAQIIPDTGEWIAGAMSYPNYSGDLIYRPHINLKFGAYYLDWARTYLDNNLISALAGYNAGPGNASRWRELSGDDDSLFVELMDFSEPRLYVRNVASNLYHYTRLYGQP